MTSIPNRSACKNKTCTYSLFAGQEVFTNAKEILPVLSQAFDEAFLFSNHIKLGDSDY